MKKIDYKKDTRLTWKIVIVMLACIVGLSLCTANGQAQPVNQEKNNIFISFQPQDQGIGLRYDRFTTTLATYASLSYGNYKLPYDCYINDHIKVAGGVIIPSSHQTYLTLGISVHSYGDQNVLAMGDEFNNKALRPVSLEFGATAELNKFVAGFRFDPIKWEGLFEFGIMF